VADLPWRQLAAPIADFCVRLQEPAIEPPYSSMYSVAAQPKEIEVANQAYPLMLLAQDPPAGPIAAQSH